MTVLLCILGVFVFATITWIVDIYVRNRTKLADLFIAPDLFGSGDRYKLEIARLEIERLKRLLPSQRQWFDGPMPSPVEHAQDIRNFADKYAELAHRANPVLPHYKGVLPPGAENVDEPWVDPDAYLNDGTEEND